MSAQQNGNFGPLYQMLSGISLFSAAGSGIRLRCYQRQAAEAIVRSVIENQGRTFVVMFPRQSGKNELQAQIEAYLLLLFSREGGEIIKVSPTWKPQSYNAMRRLERTPRRNPLTRGLWKKESGHIYRIGNAAISFLSAATGSNIVGATASLLLEVDEAQDVLIHKFDHEIAPMAASRNATRVFWGTAWTDDTLLARELQLAEACSTKSAPRVFKINAGDVIAEVPAYGQFLNEQIQRFGRDHPLIRTQYFSESLSGQTNLFNETRLQRMQGCHACATEPLPFERYILLIDVAGSDETAPQCGPMAAGIRDATAITVCSVHSGEADDLCFGQLEKQPINTKTDGVIWRCIHRQLWHNLPLTRQFEKLSALIRFWNPEYAVIDATGIGAGIASFLTRTFGDTMIRPFSFTSSSKSDLGWRFIAMIDANRWQEPVFNDGITDEEQISLQQLFFRQLRGCQSEMLPGPEKKLRWGVKNGTRDPLNGEPLHDDLVMSAALSAVLDEALWQPNQQTLIIPGIDPIKEMDKGF